MLGRFPDVLKGQSTLRDRLSRVQPEAAPSLHSRPNSVERVSSEPLPPEQPRVVIPQSHWRRRYDNDTRIPRIPSKMPATSEWVAPSSIAKEKNLNFRGPLPRPKRATATSGQPPLGSWTLQQRKAIRSVCSTKRTLHPPAIPWMQKRRHRETLPIW